MDYSILANLILPPEDAPGTYYLSSGVDSPVSKIARREKLSNVSTFVNIATDNPEHDGSTTAHWSVQKHGESRTRGDTMATRSWVVDIDVETPFTAITAADAVADICNALIAASLPIPTIAFWTGGGAHLYWCGNRCFTGDSIDSGWQLAAKGLRFWFASNFPQFSKDIQKTTDRTALIRMPMTFHGKTTSFGAPIADLDGKFLGSLTSIPWADMNKFTANMPVDAGITRSNAAPVTTLAGTQLAGSEQRFITDPGLLFSQCNALRDLAVTPDQTYPEWFAVGRLFAASKDIQAGLAAFHAFSSMYPTYDPIETETKFNDIVSSGAHPPTCDDIRRDTAACLGCQMFRGKGKNGRPHALQHEMAERKEKRAAMDMGLVDNPATATQAIPEPSSKIQTYAGGYAAVSAAASQIEAENTYLAKVRAVSGTHTYMPVAELGIAPPPALVNAAPDTVEEMFIDPVDGMMKINAYSGQGKQRSLDPHDVSLNPIFPLCLVRERSPEGNIVYGLKLAEAKLKYDTVTGNPVLLGRTVVISSKDVHGGGATLRSAITAAKLPIIAHDARSISWQRMHRWIHEQYNQLSHEHAEVKEYGFGWRREQYADQRHFIIGDRAYAAGGETKLVIQDGSSAAFSQQMAISSDLSGACEVFTRLADEGTPEMLFSMSAALGAPLMHMTSSKGVMVNFPGKTGLGKTALLSVLNSFYISAEQTALPSSGGDTMLASMNIVGVFRHLPVMIDEVTLRTEEEMGSFLLQLTQGHERNRMESNSNKLREVATWSTIVFSSSNKPIGEMIASHNDTAEAQRARVLEIFFEKAVHTGNTRYFVENFVKPLHGFGGVIGTVFIKYVLDNYDEVKQAIADTEDALKISDSPLNANDGDKFRLWRSSAAVAIVSASIGTNLGIWNITAEKMQSIVTSIAEHATQRHNEDRINAVQFTKDYIAASLDELVIPQFQNEHGNTIYEGTKVDGTSNPDVIPISAGRNNATVEMIFQEGKSHVEVAMARSALSKYCNDHNIVLDYVIDMMRSQNILRDEESNKDRRIGVTAGMYGRVNGGPNAKRLIPPAEAIIVLLPLAEPFSRETEPEYLS